MSIQVVLSSGHATIDCTGRDRGTVLGTADEYFTEVLIFTAGGLGSWSGDDTGRDRGTRGGQAGGKPRYPAGSVHTVGCGYRCITR